MKTAEQLLHEILAILEHQIKNMEATVDYLNRMGLPRDYAHGELEALSSFKQYLKIYPADGKYEVDYTILQEKR